MIQRPKEKDQMKRKRTDDTKAKRKGPDDDTKAKRKGQMMQRSKEKDR